MVGRLAALSVRPRPRIVHTYHGHVLQGYFGRAQQRTFLEIERALARVSDALIAVSPEIRDELVDLGVGRASQYHVIPVGLDLAPFVSAKATRHALRSRLCVGARTPVIAVVGRLVPIKDHETLFLALRELPGVHLAIIGDGELRTRLEGRAMALGIADRITFLGWITDLPDVVAEADVVVLASRNEGTPLAVIEAMAAGRPVVATDVGGIPHVVQHGESGLLCPPGHPGDLATAIRRLLDAPELGHQLASEGQRRVLQRFDVQRMVAVHQSLYGDLLAHDFSGRRRVLR
ncbi:MAG: glycosyltransferase [Actinomycetota bacterium]|nr:glycosyltransferase [Actinomycetota bacterium]